MEALEIHFVLVGGQFKARLVTSGGAIQDIDIVGMHFNVTGNVSPNIFKLTYLGAPPKAYSQAWAWKMYPKADHQDFSLPTNGTFNTWIGSFEALQIPPSCNVTIPRLTSSGLCAIGTADIADVGGGNNIRVMQNHSLISLSNNVQFHVPAAYPNVLMVFTTIVADYYEMKVRSTSNFGLPFHK